MELKFLLWHLNKYSILLVRKSDIKILFQKYTFFFKENLKQN